MFRRALLIVVLLSGKSLFAQQSTEAVLLGSVFDAINTAAFAANPIYTFGNAGRNILRADGTTNLDLSAHKKIKITEGVNAQLRLEAFNIANHDVLAAPNAAVGSTTFGQVTSAGNTARELQAAVKIVF
jgi:hypothetical protein